jgi:hypothetical protein
MKFSSSISAVITGGASARPCEGRAGRVGAVPEAARTPGRARRARRVHDYERIRDEHLQRIYEAIVREMTLFEAQQMSRK